MAEVRGRAELTDGRRDGDCGGAVAQPLLLVVEDNQERVVKETPARPGEGYVLQTPPAYTGPSTTRITETSAMVETAL